jgi:tripartite ATP-independent transporter DctM subunit
LSPFLVGIIGFIALILALSLGVHIAFAMALVGTVGLFLTTGVKITLASLELLPLSSVNSYGMVVIPLFILMGNLSFVAGITRDLYDTGYKWFGRLPGGLAMATTFASAGFAASTGSSVGMVAAMSRIALPEMDRYGYDRNLSLGSIAGAGTLGVLIPPSIIAVLYAITTEQSVGKILIGSIFPGILTAFVYIAMIGIRCILNPELGPRAHGIPWKETFISLKGVWGIVLLFGAVMGFIYSGIATPTEAGAIGCLGALLLALGRNKLRWQNFKEALFDTVKIGTMILTIAIGAQIFTLFLARSGFAAAFISLLLDLNVSPMTLVLLFLLIYIPLGMFFEPMSMILLTMPITFPVLEGLEINGIWYGIMVIIMIEVSLETPPVGLNVYVLKGAVDDADLFQIFKSVQWYVLCELIVIALIFIFPDIVLILPNMMKG